MSKMKLIDTSAWIEYFRSKGDDLVRESVAEAIRNRQAAWCELIYLELLRGNERQRKQAKLIIETLPCLHLDESCWRKAFILASLVGRAGKPVPNTDLLIFACAQNHKASLLHRDKHFEQIEKVLGEKAKGEWREC